MARTAVAIALALLGGCAAAPSDLMEAGTPVRFDSHLAPAAAAECVGRNAEEYKSFGAAPFRASWRTGKEPGTSETIVHDSGSLGAVVLAIAKRSPQGSSVTMWHRGVPAIEITGLLKTMQAGC